MEERSLTRCPFCAKYLMNDGNVTPRAPAKKAVVLIEPKTLRGRVVWQGQKDQAGSSLVPTHSHTSR